LEIFAALVAIGKQGIYFYAFYKGIKVGLFTMDTFDNLMDKFKNNK
jgi:hypothetical protein